MCGGAARGSSQVVVCCLLCADLLMKPYRDLFPRVCSFENLHRALREARRGKRDCEEVAAFEYDAEKNLLDRVATTRSAR